MDENMAFDQFQQWYEDCMENDISPEEVVTRMGGMALITDEALVNRLRDEGDIPA